MSADIHFLQHRSCSWSWDQQYMDYFTEHDINPSSPHSHTSSCLWPTWLTVIFLTEPQTKVTTSLTEHTIVLVCRKGLNNWQSRFVPADGATRQQQETPAPFNSNLRHASSIYRKQLIQTQGKTWFSHMSIYELTEHWSPAEIGPGIVLENWICFLNLTKTILHLNPV